MSKPKEPIKDWKKELKDAGYLKEKGDAGWEEFNIEEFANAICETTRRQERQKLKAEIREWIDNSEMDGVEINAVLDYLNK